jgi:hypothetical protein
MATQNYLLFVAYARADLEQVEPLRPFLDSVRDELRFRALPVDLWIDETRLAPGEAWNDVIAQALQDSIGVLVLVSPRAMASEWVLRELSIAEASERLVLPVLLYRPDDWSMLPPAISNRQVVDLSGRRTKNQIREAAEKIVNATEYYLRSTPQPEPVVSKAEAPKIAEDIAQQIRDSIQPPTQARPTSVFVVHGHASQALDLLEQYLSSVGISAVVLSRRDESPQSLFQKFMSVAAQARFAIVLLSADDYGSF